MKTDKISTNPSFGMALAKIPKKAYKIGGSALVAAEPQLKELAKDTNIEIIAKKGLLIKTKSLIIFATKIGEKKGQWVSLSTDPGKYVPRYENYINVDKFTKEAIIDAAKNAKAELSESNGQLSRATAALFPVDSAILVKGIRKLFSKK